MPDPTPDAVTASVNEPLASLLFYQALSLRHAEPGYTDEAAIREGMRLASVFHDMLRTPGSTPPPAKEPQPVEAGCKCGHPETAHGEDGCCVQFCPFSSPRRSDTTDEKCERCGGTRLMHNANRPSRTICQEFVPPPDVQPSPAPFAPLPEGWRPKGMKSPDEDWTQTSATIIRSRDSQWRGVVQEQMRLYTQAVAEVTRLHRELHELQQKGK